MANGYINIYNYKYGMVFPTVFTFTAKDKRKSESTSNAILSVCQITVIAKRLSAFYYIRSFKNVKRILFIESFVLTCIFLRPGSNRTKVHNLI